MLLVKLVKCGFDYHSVFWFGSYLRNRCQYVKVNKILSDKEISQCGVPQGSVLGPLLLVLYTNEILAVVAQNALAGAMETSTHEYTDDLQLFTSCNVTLLDAAVSKLAKNVK